MMKIWRSQRMAKIVMKQETLSQLRRFTYECVAPRSLSWAAAVIFQQEGWAGLLPFAALPNIEVDGLK